MKNNVCKRMAVLLLALCLAMVLAGCAKPAKAEVSCSVLIDCGFIWDHEGELNAAKAEFVPQDGLILDETEYAMEEGATAFDLLQAACEAQNIHLDAEDGPYGKYIKGVGQIYSGDCGEMSGWLYTINGQSAEVGSEVYELQQGDVIRWVFICDWEEDLV